MAKTETNTINVTERKAQVKKGVKKIHDGLLKTSEEVLTGSIKTGEKWQKLMEKAIKKSEPIAEKNIDIAFNAAETIKGQVQNSAERVRTLLGIEEDAIEKAIKKITNISILKRFKGEVEEIVEEVSDAPIVKRAKRAATKAKVEIVDAIDEIKENIEEAKETVMDTVESFTQSTEVSDLKVIDGIGPKLEGILNDAGIKSYSDLAKISANKLQSVIDNAGPRYRMHNPQDWKAQAELALKGDLEALTTWIKNKKNK